MEYYALPKEEVLRSLGADERGLSGEEAGRRLQRYGSNQLREGKKRSLAALFFSQFRDLMTVILICAAFLSAVLAFLTRDKNQLADTAILLFIILLNAVVGFLQQYRADSALEKLKKLSVCTAKAVRDGRVVELDASLLVPGDVIELAEGDRVPADCLILSSENLRCDESSLTGESHPAAKRPGIVRTRVLAERSNSVFSSAFCVAGSARCVVVHTGMQTEVGRIADLLGSSAPTPTPLDRTVERLGKLISVTVLSVAIVLFLGGLLSHRVGFLENLMSAVAVAVAAIPEGMGAVVTIILAMGVQRMAAARAVAKKLSAVETLGNCTCICTDKTGTLTKNKMTVEAIVTDLSAAEEAYSGTAVQQRLLTCIRICNTVKGAPGAYVGDPTEIALVEYADTVGFSCPFRRLGGIPFTSERKRMSVAAETARGRALYVKGGADVVLARCTRIADGTGARGMTEEDRKKAADRVRALSDRAMRVLAFAEGGYGGAPAEEGLVFLGIAAMLDPPKEGAKAAVTACRGAGIHTVMITGDSADTAYAIASRLGIAASRREVITGEEMDALGEAYASRADAYSVYARVSPKHKSEIVRALQKKGEVVAMTGDGVNDAPSIRAADIGIAMGSGTDVTKDAADMVISDDDFSTIVRAAEEGRNVFYNVKKTISFFLATNFAEVLSVLLVTLFLWRFEFLSSTQLLWINLITDSLPVLALGVERTEGAMRRPPVSEKEIFSRRSLCAMAYFGLVQTALAVGIFCFGLAHWGNGAASTAAFFTLSFLELFHAFNVRKEEGALRPRDLVSNRALLFTVALGVGANMLLCFVPAFAEAFALTPLTSGQWGAVFLCSAAVVPLGEAYKFACRRAAFRRRRSNSPARGNAQ